ncbi:MAG: hypothetical protein CMG74_09595 [Candidatus Marinimicrobia bacterium]|nr:hypothetical protein [Candidatus Neomarinimicrobiota bacterium]|tara:strand:+ start:187 stop:369 length:183 start_codon:yes stop_codon:yes gene_type:complete
MRNKLYNIFFTALSLISTVMAQDPPSLPDAPDQGPITGIAWVVAAGVLVFAHKIRDQYKK